MSQQYPDQTHGSLESLRQEGREMVGETQRDAEQVVRHVGEEAGEVLDTARREVRDVVDEARDAISREADERTRQFGHALHGLSDDLHRMAAADGADHSAAADYVDALATTLDRVAERMEHGGSRGVVDSVRATAGRRPGAFFTGSMVAGFVVGRIIRNGDGSAVLSGDGEGDSAERRPEPAGEIDLREPTGASKAAAGVPDPELATAGVVRHTGPVPPPPMEPPPSRQEPF